MNEESILYIINYFNQYSDQPPEVLVKNIISSGYNMTDLKEALRRMGISPIVIPGYQESPPPPSKPLFPKIPLIIAGVVSLLVISGLSSWAFMNSRNQVKKTENAGTIQQGVIDQKQATPSGSLIPILLPQTPTAELSPTSVQIVTDFPSSENPIRMVEYSLGLKDYGVTKRIYETLDPYAPKAVDDSNYQNNYTANGTEYYKQGQLVRVDFTTSGKPVIIIYENQRDINIYPNDKNYSIFTIPDNLAKVQTHSFFYDLKKMTEDHKIIWKNIASNEWIVDWIPTIDDSSKLPQIKIILDQNTHLLSKKLWKDSYENSPKWIVTEYKYEKIDDIENLLKIPEGYTEITQN